MRTDRALAVMLLACFGSSGCLIMLAEPCTDTGEALPTKTVRTGSYRSSATSEIAFHHDADEREIAVDRTANTVTIRYQRHGTPVVERWRIEAARVVR